MEHGTAVRWQQNHCPPPVSLSFSLGKSTCSIPGRGNTMNFAIELLKFIFPGYDIAAALSWALKFLFKCSSPWSIYFPKLWNQKRTGPDKKSRRGVRVIFNHTSSRHRRQTFFPLLHCLLFLCSSDFLWRGGAFTCSHLGPDFIKHLQPPTKCCIPLPEFFPEQILKTP